MTPPPIWQAVAQAYRDLQLSFRILWIPAAISCLVSGFGNIMETALIGDDVSSSNKLLLRFLSGTVQQFFFTPFLIAVHRLVILGEAENTYRLDVSTQRFQRYFWLAVAFDFTNYLTTFLTPVALRVSAAPNAADLISIAEGCALIALFIRLITAFPAFAVDAPDVTLDGAFNETRGRFWSTLLIVALAHLPVWLFLVGVARTLYPDPRSPQISGISGIIANLVTGTAAIVIMTLLVVISSRLYMLTTSRTKPS